MINDVIHLITVTSYDAQRRERALTFSVFDIFQQVYVQVIDLCTFRSEIIHISPKIRF